MCLKDVWTCFACTTIRSQRLLTLQILASSLYCKLLEAWKKTVSLLQYVSVSKFVCRQLSQSSITFHVNRHPSWKFLEDARVFVPRMICGNIMSHDIAQYKAIPWSMKDNGQQHAAGWMDHLRCVRWDRCASIYQYWDVIKIPVGLIWQTHHHHWPHRHHQ